MALFYFQSVSNHLYFIALFMHIWWPYGVQILNRYNLKQLQYFRNIVKNARPFYLTETDSFRDLSAPTSNCFIISNNSQFPNRNNCWVLEQREKKNCVNLKIISKIQMNHFSNSKKNVIELRNKWLRNQMNICCLVSLTVAAEMPHSRMNIDKMKFNWTKNKQATSNRQK